VHLAAVEMERAVEGVASALLIAIALVLGGVLLRRRWRGRRDARAAEPLEPALARFADAVASDPTHFGGGAVTARVRRRVDGVVYGYPAAVEEYENADGGAPWCTLTVSLPGRVPFLVVDHWHAVGRPGVPQPAALRPRLGDPTFDSAYVVGVHEAEAAERVLVPAARAVLLDTPVQRLVLQGSTVTVRTFDGARLDDAQTAALGDVLARFLASTPSFLQSSMAVSGRLRAGAPLPSGR